MIMLVTADNYLVMFVGWSIIRICSCLLIFFWFKIIAANYSSLTATLTQREDGFLTLGILTIALFLGSLDYGEILSLSPFMDENLSNLNYSLIPLSLMADTGRIS